MARVAQSVQLRCLYKLCSPKSHRRQPVDRSVPSYRGHERFSAIPPAAAGGSFSPKLCFPLLDTRDGIERSTGCRRWDSRAFLAPCRPGLNDPPAAAGGIPEARTCVETLAGQFALQSPINLPSGKFIVVISRCQFLSDSGTRHSQKRTPNEAARPNDLG